MEITAIGACVCDTLYTLGGFPTEDTKFIASSSRLSGGGPAATGLVAASKLGARCAFVGSLTDDAAGDFLKKDFERFSIDTSAIESIPGYRSFTSVILLNKKTGSRTCVVDRGNIPKNHLSETQKNSIGDILMVDGNDLPRAIDAAYEAKKRSKTVLYDAGGRYEGIEPLLSLTDILIPSKEFALGVTGEENTSDAAKSLFSKYSPKVVIITEGTDGGILYDGRTVSRYPAFRVDTVDSNGAGDVFHGAFAYCMSRKMPYKDACVFSSAASAIKCTRLGSRDGSPTLNEVEEFISKRL